MVFRCSCGQVELEARARPILASVCHCDDCQRASRELESLPGAPRVLGEGGGTEYVLYRKDRLVFTKGKELLRDHRLEREAFTKRVVASCCNSAMFLDYEKGHWFSLYRDRVMGPKPSIQMRVQTKYKAKGALIAGDVPSSKGFPAGFIFRLLWAKVGMLLGS